MALTSIKSYYEISNPYLNSSSVLKQEELLDAEALADDSQLIQVADRIVEWGQKALFTDYEKQIDYTGFVARIIDKGILGIMLGLEGFVIADNIFLFTHHRNFFDQIPLILKCILLPAEIIFFILGIIEGFAELINLNRSVKFLAHMERNTEIFDRVSWLKTKYFTLDSSEANKIFNYMESYLPQLSKKQKALRFEQIAIKALDLRYEALSRRITPGLSEQVAKELPSILKGLTSTSHSVREQAAIRGRILIKSVTQQSKVKILVHLIALVAISLTIVTMVAAFTGIVLPAFFIGLESFSGIFSVSSFLIDKGIVNTQASRLYDKLASIPTPDCHQIST